MKNCFIILTIIASIFPSIMHGNESKDNKTNAAVVIEFGIADINNIIPMLEGKGFVVKLGAECCITPEDPEYNELGGIWIGKKVSYLDAKKVIIEILPSYPHLSYYDFFSAEEGNYPKAWDRTIYIGGSKWAVHKDIREIDSVRAAELFSEVSSQAELEKLILSFRKKPKNSRDQ
ncbi:hypothetical protein [Microbulbifer rhizosphaerae]|uniref:Uncharacterized protein n=1 Tax=Microbulbifer rhizosphaerae TaxID=1562603 RepID=A0A7W4ZAP4_9GAMM|nr:hypothetical protein [Microbulbifer rhizosphaerae]MBB3061574.1 hypothetical protein [Microbulbifer rhizosphaerae]